MSCSKKIVCRVSSESKSRVVLIFSQLFKCRSLRVRLHRQIQVDQGIYPRKLYENSIFYLRFRKLNDPNRHDKKVPLISVVITQVRVSLLFLFFLKKNGDISSQILFSFFDK